MNQIVLTIQYQKNDDFTEKLFHCVSQSKCQLRDVKLLTPAPIVTLVIFNLTCNWTQLAHLELQLTELKEHYSFTKHIEHIHAVVMPTKIMPYNLYMITADAKDMIAEIIQFLVSLSVKLHELSIASYQAPATQTSMLEITCLVMIPIDKGIHVFRESVIQFCDDNDIEVILEPKRH